MEEKKYPIELEVITPLSVGNGNDKDWVRGLDFVQKDGKVYVLNLQKASKQGVNVEQLAYLFQDSDEIGIINLLGKKMESVSKYIFKSPVKSINNIKTFLRTQYLDKPIVAGSSLKGSIRSALFNHLRTTEQRNEDVFGTMKEGTDLMRFIRVADIEMPSTILVNSKIFNLRGSGSEWQGGWKHAKSNNKGETFTTGKYSPQGFNTLYECVKPGQKGLGNISLAANAYSLLENYGNVEISHAKQKHFLINSPINELFKIINEVTKAYLRKEKEFFEKYPTHRTGEIITNINDLLALIPSDGSSCLLKMSAGVGFHSITGDWQFEDYDTDLWNDGKNEGKKKYKSRKTVEYEGKLQLMGFVRLRSLADEIKRQKALEKERLEFLETERRKKEMYDTLLFHANQLYESKNWDEAIAKANEAAGVCPELKEYLSIIDRCNNEKISEQYKREQKENDIRNFRKPLVEVLKGKSSVGNIIGTTSKWIKMGNSFTEQEYHVLISCLKDMPAKEIKKKRKDFEKAINQEWTNKVWKELNIQ